MHYLVPSLKSLELTRLPVTIIDDASEPDVQEYLRKTVQRTGWKLYTNSKNLGVAVNNISRANYVDTEWMYITDSDVIYSSEFNYELQKLLVLCKATNGIGSLFNTGNRHTRIMEETEHYLRKGSIGGVSMLIKTDLFKTITADYQSHLRGGYTGWDYAIVFYAADNNIPIWVTRDSYVDHIGEYGAHSGGISDKAINFIP